MKRLIPYFLFAGIFLSLFIPPILSGKSALLYGDDILHQYYFYRQFFNSWLHEGVFPWWNPYYFGGAPFIANPIVNIWYPLNWLYLVIPLPYAYIVHFWFHLTLGASGVYLLLRFLLPKKESFIPAVTGGLVFSLSGFMSARILAGHVDVIAAASYMPIVAFFFFRLMSGRRLSDIAWAGLVFGLQLLAGYHTMGFFTLLVIGFVVLYKTIQKRTFRHSIPVVIAVLLGFGISAISLLPIQEFVRASIRTIDKPYAWASYGSLPVLAFMKQLVQPFPFGKPLEYIGPPPNFFEHAFFFGRMSVFILVLGSIMSVVRRKFTSLWILFSAIFLFGTFMSLGNFAPVDIQNLVWKILPFYHMLRIPPRHLIMVVFSTSVLIGLGMSLIQNRLTKTLISLFILLELFLYAQSFIMTKDLPEQRHDTELIAFLQNEKELIRILPNFGCWIEPRSSLDFDEVMAERIFSATGYDPTIYRPYYDFIDATNGNPGSSILEHDVQIPYLSLSSLAMKFLNIKYLFVPTYADPLNGNDTEQFVLVKEDINRQYRLYEQTTFVPRFFFVPTSTVFDTTYDLTEALRNNRIDLDHTVGMVKNDIIPMVSYTDCKEGEIGSVEVLSYTPNTITLHTSTPCNAFLVSSEVMYPGWRATIDGRETKIITGNMAFRTLFMPKGDHEITFRFVPLTVYLGAILSLISLGIVIILIKKK